MKQGTMNILFFVLKTKLLKNGEAPVLMRITINGDYDDVRIQRSVPLRLWNAAKGYSKGKDRASNELNNYISELHARALEKHKELTLEQALITPRLILKRVFGKDTEMRTLLGTMQEGIKEMEALVNIDYSPVTINRYKNVVKKLRQAIPAFYDKEDITFHELTSDFVKSFDLWKSHSTLTLLATQDLPTFLYYMIDPLKSWCWGAILFYPFKNSRFS